MKKNADKATKPTQPKAAVSKGAVVAEALSVQGAAEKAVAVKKATKAKPPSLPLAPTGGQVQDKRFLSSV